MIIHMNSEINTVTSAGVTLKVFEFSSNITGHWYQIQKHIKCNESSRKANRCCHIDILLRCCSSKTLIPETRVNQSILLNISKKTIFFVCQIQFFHYFLSISSLLQAQISNYLQILRCQWACDHTARCTIHSAC